MTFHLWSSENTLLNLLPIVINTKLCEEPCRVQPWDSPQMHPNNGKSLLFFEEQV